MRKIIFFILFVLSFNCLAQNLIPNPSFEQYTSCPSTPDQLSYCFPWHSFKETPDYCNTCSITPIITPPNAYNGFQYPHSGNAFVGFFTFVNNGPNNRELIGTPLLTSLITGQKYFISFFVNLGGATNPGSTIASNKTGVKFSTVSYSYLHPAPINNTAHFYSNNIITDTVKWTLIKGSFIADSAYSYIIIGNFFDDSLTDTINLSINNNQTAYYYIDDVCVSTDSLYCENWVGVNEQSVKKEEITIYPNPAYNNVSVSSKNGENIKHIVITDLTGRQVYSNNYGTGSIETEMNISFLQPGNYFVTITTSENIHTEKLVIVK